MERFKFVDLFAGIGGFHLAMHRLGGECVFASEIDEHARKTYEANFKDIADELFRSNLFNKDIRTVSPRDIPDFDLLCAGFPCQPFSQAGLKRGFEDNHKSERGNLFFNIAEIIEEKRPRAFFLENVRGLITHDNGETFRVIRNILEQELGYSVYFKVVNASDYGLPQLRPRVFIVGFRDDSFFRGFEFPLKRALKYTMSDVWNGNCTRDIGFTIRVGGRGSPITDRRNWDAYEVDGEIKQLSYIEAKKMQGFPEEFMFPVSATQAIKQLGNSVAIDAVEIVGDSILTYLEVLKNSAVMKELNVKKGLNKGEWSELLVFIKLILERKLFLSDIDLKPSENYFKINKVTTQNLDREFLLTDDLTITIKKKETEEKTTIQTSEILNNISISEVINFIKNAEKTFDIGDFKVIQDILGFNVVKGGTSLQKADIALDIENKLIKKANVGFGIKSFLGSKPTLLNASGNTNFIFKVKGLKKENLDEVNNIKSKFKLVDRVTKIVELGGEFVYQEAEKEAMEFNLKMVDSSMSMLIGEMLLCFYLDRISSVPKIVERISSRNNYTNDDKKLLISKVKRLLVDILLGFIPGTKWSGVYGASGTIVMKNDGEQVCFHIIEIEKLKDYLFENIKFDTPSTTRHKFGSLYIEKDGIMFFKLNMQLRF